MKVLFICLGVLALLGLLCRLLLEGLYRLFGIQKRLEAGSPAPKHGSDCSGEFLVEAEHRLAPNLHGERKL